MGRFSKYILIVATLLGLIVGIGHPDLALAQEQNVSDVWVADNGDGTYTNPILHADYSDPDVVKVGDDFYMTSSSFNAVPALPILHSKDLVNWELINHAVDELPPVEHFRSPQHGNGVWAPSIRYHEGEFYIYWGDPDFGIYMVKTDDPAGDWEEPVLVKPGKGLIDPSPLWDDDGRAYLVHAFARSRSGINTVLVVQEMKSDGTEMIGDPILVFDGHENGNRVVEGPKFKKRGDWYYILAPAGGVTEGWQLAMRSKNPFGPYEARRVLQQGNTDINGPHQGGLVELDSGESWFVHFQDKGVYGRIVHLNPVEWRNGWPMMGEDQNDDGVGEPVITHKKPDVGESYPIQTPPESDEFNSKELGKQWQWHGNPENTWALTSNFGFIRLYGKPWPEGYRNLWDVPNLLLQKFPAPEFQATAKLKFTPHMIGEKAGLVVMGEDYGYVAIQRNENGFQLVQVNTYGADAGEPEEIIETVETDAREVWFRAQVREGGATTFSYSTNGKEYNEIGKTFQAKEGRWIGAKIGLFALQPRDGASEDYLDYSSQHSGFANVDWFRISALEN
ncbi:glycoside hydrolase family 43 protein [Gracilimonas mengyeensis]|uniref:Beta-xylosidase n=1 Tax=Gracilimonas mengyeensis TaxID=1302730 RepID=A0A521FDM1_9BACT|nr:glycoside hydrolase 43 family protein [Gracilimonas mengyeensis]SMO94229.1 Beta-xylosidase [Gracilimonas mengyeensis]